MHEKVEGVRGSGDDLIGSLESLYSEGGPSGETNQVHEKDISEDESRKRERQLQRQNDKMNSQRG